MRKQIICFIGLAIAIYASTAYAEDCEVRPSNLDDFGHHRLGQRLKALPKGVKRLPNCAVYRKYHTFDCEFVDAYGNSYLASGHEIVKLERVPVKSYSRPLPRPLRFGMTIEEATSALTAMDPKINLTTDHSDGGSSLDTGECLKDRHGVTYFLSLRFDEAGGLSKVTAAFDTAED
jgi:hypothetical protein